MQAVREKIQKLVNEHQGSSVRNAECLRLDHRAGRIEAAVLADGTRIEATDAVVVLALGSWIEGFLEQSKIERNPISRAPVATGIFVFIVQLDERHKSVSKGTPALSQNGYAEFIPPTTVNGLAKITRILTFTNKEGGSLSYPKDLSGSHLAIQMMLEAKNWARDRIPRLKQAKITGIKCYWDGTTPTQDPVIARHPQFENLVNIVGLSYNWAKHLTNLGALAVKVIDGEQIDPKYAWGPDTNRLYENHPHLQAKHDFAELELIARKNPDVQAWKERRTSYNDDGYLEVI